MGKKHFLAVLALLAAVAIVAGCVQSGTQDQQNQNAIATDGTGNGIQPGNGGSEQASAPLKEFNLTAKRFSFEPGTIEVSLGDKVRLNITVPADNTTHGLKIQEFGVRADLPAGKTTTVEFTASKAGTFEFSCDVLCGEGHSEMKGTLIVK